jgi:hypothetical protein
MNLDPIFGLNILGSVVAFGLLARLYLWPQLRRLPREDALALLIVPHTFRFVGLSFLEQGVVSPSLPTAFAVSAAYGDLAAALLAIGAVIALTRRASFAIPLVWVFNLWGTTDLVLAFYRGFANGLDAGSLGAAYYIPTFVVPGLLVLHALVFRVLFAGGRLKNAAIRVSAISDGG